MKIPKTLKDNSLSLANISRGFFYLFFAVFPFQLKFLIFERSIFPSGFFNPYLSQFFYLSDLILILGVLFFGLAFLFGKIKNFSFGDKRIIQLLFLFLCFYFLPILYSKDAINSFFYFLRLLEFFVMFVFVGSNFLSLKKVIYCFICGVSVSALIAIGQYFAQESLGLKYLGEQVISSSALDSARYRFGDEVVLRSYGTFPHPNVLAGFLVMTLFLILHCWNELQRARKFLVLAFVLCFLALIFTFSRSGWLALFLGLLSYVLFLKWPILIWLKKYWRFFLCGFLGLIFVIWLTGIDDVLFYRIFVGDRESVEDRLLFLQIAKEMFGDNIFGVGAGNFTLMMQNYTDIKLFPWQFQPVHNIFVLSFVELGIFGGLMFLSIFAYAFVYLWKLIKDFSKNREIAGVLFAVCLSFLVIGLFDHYLFSLYQGQFLFWMFLGIFNRAAGLFSAGRFTKTP